MADRQASLVRASLVRVRLVRVRLVRVRLPQLLTVMEVWLGGLGDLLAGGGRL